MSEDLSANSGIQNAKQELLEWLASGNKTYGYDALVAYDRATINAVYREQYLQRYKDARLPAISGTEPSGDREYRVLENVLLGPPMVSFEDSSITSDEPMVRVTLPVVGGRETKLLYGGTGYVTATRINEISALESPNISGLLKFKSLAHEDSVGVIALDLKDGTYQVNFGETIWDPSQGSSVIKDQFAAWDESDRVWVVSRIKRNSGEMAISDFVLRSQRKLPGATRAVEGYGEGAVVAFVTMENSFENKSMPTREADVKYLVPEDKEDEYTATVILQDGRFMLTFFKHFFMDRDHAYSLMMPPPAPFECQLTRSGAVTRIVMTEGTLIVGSKYHTGFEHRYPDRRAARLSGGFAPINANNQLTIEIEKPNGLNGMQYVLMVKFEITDFPMTLATSWNDGTDNGWAKSCYIPVTGACTLRYNFQLDQSRQSIVSSLVSNNITALSFKSDQFESLLFTWSEMEPHIDWMARVILLGVDRDLDYVTGLETLPLSSLLLNWPFNTRLSQVDLRQDMVMFGHISRALVEFTITDEFPVLAAGSTHRFATSKPATVVWSVRNLPGESHPKGSINASTGVYTAPTLDQLSGSQVQVVVTATSGLLRASAVVSIVRRSLQLNPLIQFTKIGSRADTRVTVGSIAATTPTWGAIAPEEGRLEVVPGEPDARLFWAPDTAIAGATVRVVPINVTVGNITEQSYVAVLHNAFTAFEPLASNFNSSNRSVQLSLEVDPGGIIWEVVEGSATISSTGLLIADPDPALPFALVTATLPPPLPSLPAYWGYILLALPLAPFPSEPPPRLLTRSRVVLG